MFGVWVVASRDFRSYFGSPVAYAVLVVFLAVTGYFFTLFLFHTREANMQSLFRSMGMVLIFLIPALTMRLLAEEKRSRTLDLVLACPVRDSEVILGKYLGSLAFYGVMLLMTLHYPLILAVVGDLDYVPIVVGYLGAFLLGGAILATGLWSSSLTESQVVAYVIAFGIVLLMWSVNSIGSYTGSALSEIVKFLSISQHYDDFTRGILDGRHVVFYVSWTVVFLGLSILSLRLRRWL
jgi:ABC-2 type transport system permease protein